MLLKQYGLSGDAASGFEWIQAHVSDRYERANLNVAVYKGLVINNPASAMAWAAELQSGEAQRLAYRAIVEEWVKRPRGCL